MLLVWVCLGRVQFELAVQSLYSSHSHILCISSDFQSPIDLRTSTALFTKILFPYRLPQSIHSCINPKPKKSHLKIDAFFNCCFLNMLSVLDFDLLQFLMPRNSTSSLEMVPPKPRSAIDVMWAPAKSACKSTVAGCDSFVSCRVNRSESRIKMRFGI